MMMRHISRRLFANAGASRRFLSGATGNSFRDFDLFNPTEEHAQLRTMLRAFVESEVDPQALAYNRKEEFNYPLFKKLGDLGLLGITADSQYGGSGMDATAACIVHEELASSDPAFCLSYLAHSMLFVNNVNQNCSHEQKAKYLPGACDGSLLCGMGMSEPGAGTDVLGMSTTATKSADGSHYTLNGTKMWITNGTKDGTDTGDVFLVYAKTGQGRAPGDLSAFLVEKGMPGFSLGSKITDKCGMRASNTAELVFDNVKVPVENLVAKEGGAGLCMMRNLEIERIVLAAMSLGIARRSIEVMSRWVLNWINLFMDCVDVFRVYFLCRVIGMLLIFTLPL
jgi:isovaleryl-CoA dehydrogenase